jgi:hypothetical protein
VSLSIGEAGMDKGITGDLGITIGMDVSDRFAEAFAIDDQGEWIESWRMPTRSRMVFRSKSSSPRYSSSGRIALTEP